MAKPCTTCKFYKPGAFFGLMEPTCLHPKSVDKGFTHTDAVTGVSRVWPDQPMPCYQARWNACGSNATLWEHR